MLNIPITLEITVKVKTEAGETVSQDIFKQENTEKPFSSEEQPTLLERARMMPKSGFVKTGQFTSEESKKAVELSKQNFSLEQIAQRLGRKKHSVYSHLKFVRSVSDIPGVSKTKGRKTSRPGYRTINDEDKAKIARLFSEGKSIWDISQAIPDVLYQTIWSRVKMLQKLARSNPSMEGPSTETPSIEAPDQPTEAK